MVDLPAPFSPTCQQRTAANQAKAEPEGAAAPRTPTMQILDSRSADRLSPEKSRWSRQ